LSRLTDTRAFAIYPTRGIAFSVFLMIVARLGSLHALEQDRPRPGWLRRLGAPLASADTIGRVFTKLQVEPLRDAVHAVYQRFKRNKALGPSHGHDVLIIDGHETQASFRRCCPGCLERRLSDGRIQYYHRLVLAMIAGRPVPFLLDIEMQLKGEDEVACATRLLQRLLGTYLRAFNLVVADGLYVRAPLVSLLRRHHKHVLFVLKDERRDLLKDARGIFAGQAPIVVREKALERQIWDVEDLTTWTAFAPIRVVRSVETRTVVRQRDRQKETTQTEWIWMTTVPQTEISGARIVELGHGRWAIENRAFRELATYWHADHVYRHHPRAIEAFWMMVLLALNLFRAFYILNLKPVFRDRHTQIYIASQIAADLASHGPAP
jgi:hypothetical protein